MGCFLLPKSTINLIEGAIRQFWWGAKEGRYMAWISWRNLCQPKANGGLGFRDLRCFNLSLLAKQGWRLITNLESLVGSLIKAKYFANCSFLEAHLGSRPSATWRGIVEARNYLKQGIRMRIGNGEQTRIWTDSRLLDYNNFKNFGPKLDYLLCLEKVAELISPMSGSWDDVL